MNIKYIDKPSKNFDDVQIKPEWIVIHCIGYDEKKALGILTGEDPQVPVSAHYFVPQLDLNKMSYLHNNQPEYPIYRLVSEVKKAYHAGISRWQNLEKFNNLSIGIEFNSPNYAYALEKDSDHLNWYHFEKFSPDQIQAGITLLKEVIERHDINPANILTHADIAAWRSVNAEPCLGKTDPGSFFPMEFLAQNGIGVWPKFERTRTSKLDTSIKNTQKLLKSFGYHLEETGTLDMPTITSIRAFKIHFMPEEYHNDIVSETINERMIIGLENLVDKQYKYEILKQNDYSMWPKVINN